MKIKNSKPIDWDRINAARAKSVKKYREKRLEQLKNKEIPNPNKVKIKIKINKVSNQRAVLNKVYGILIRELKPQHTKCEGNLDGCTKVATQVHHKKGRRGLLLILSKYFCYLCNNCHDLCTADSKTAKEIGLSLPINSHTEYKFTDREKELIEQYRVFIPGNINIRRV